MPNSKITKSIISDAMKQLMKEKLFSDISVSDIINRCSISRKTFYYHFADKYDVVNWIFYTEMFDSILESTTLENWIEGSIKFCSYMYNNKKFYTNALSVNGQNSFTEYLNNLTRMQVEKLCTEACGNKSINKDDKSFMIDFYYSAFIGILTAWIKNGMKDSPELIVKRWKAMSDKTLENYIIAMKKQNE